MSKNNNEKKLYAGIALLAAILTIGSAFGCANNDKVVEGSTYYKQYYDKFSKDTKDNDVKQYINVEYCTGDIIDYIYIEYGPISAYCYYDTNMISFQTNSLKYELDDNEKIFISDKFYGVINQIIEKYEIDFIQIFDGEVLNLVDFNRINQENICSLRLDLDNTENCVLSSFEGVEYKYLDIWVSEKTNFTQVSELFSTLDLTNTYVNLYFPTENSDIKQQYFDMLSEFDYIQTVNIMLFGYDNNLDLSNIKTSSLKLCIFQEEQTVDFNITLNDCVKELQIRFVDNAIDNYNTNSLKIDSIMVNSNNNELFTELSIARDLQVELKDDSKVILPDHSILYFRGTNTPSFNEQSISSLQNLSVIAWQDPFTDDVAMIYYNSDITYDKADEMLNRFILDESLPAKAESLKISYKKNL